MVLPRVPFETNRHTVVDTDATKHHTPLLHIQEQKGPETPNMEIKGAASGQEHQETPSPVPGFVQVDEGIRGTRAAQRFTSNHSYDTSHEESPNAQGLAGIVDSVGSKVRQLARVLKQVEGMVSSLEVRMDGSTRERAALQSKNEHLIKTIKGLESDVRVAQRECRDAERKVAHIEDKVEDTERDVRRLDEEYKRLEESKASDSFQWDLLRIDLEKEVDVLRGMVRAREDRVARDAWMVSALQAKAGELESEITLLQKENEIRVQNFSTQKAELAAVLDALAREQKHHAMARESVQSLENMTIELKDGMKELEAAKKDVETRVELLQSDKHHLANQIEFLQTSRTNDLERSEKMIQEMTSCHAEALDAKEEEIRTQKSLHEAAVADVSSLRQQLGSIEDTFEKQKSSFMHDLDQLHSANATLEKSNSLLKASARDLEQAHDAERSRANDLEHKLEEAIQETKKMKDRNTSLEENEGILKEQLQECKAAIKLHEDTQEKEKNLMEACLMHPEDETNDNDDQEAKEIQPKRSRHSSRETSAMRKIARRMKASQHHTQTGATKP